MNRLIWNELDDIERRAALTRPVQTVAEQTRATVAELMNAVRTRGDAALREITARFDGAAPERF